MDEYDLLGLERPSYDSDTGYWGSDGYYHSTEEEKEQTRKEVEEWMKDNW